MALLLDGVDPALLELGASVMRLSLHPDGLAPRIADLADVTLAELTVEQFFPADAFTDAAVRGAGSRTGPG